MAKASLIVVVSLWLVVITHCGDVIQTRYATIPSSHDERNVIFTLHTGSGLTSYRQIKSTDPEINRFVITGDGRVYSCLPLHDLVGKKLAIDIISQNILTGKTSQSKLVLEVFDKNRQQLQLNTAHIADKLLSKRVRRAVTDISIEIEVRETVTEVTIDYAVNGVVESSSNRFYLEQNDQSVAFSRIELQSGKLVVNDKSPMDYETAPSQQYKPTVYVNNTINGLGKYIAHLCPYYLL